MAAASDFALVKDDVFEEISALLPASTDAEFADCDQCAVPMRPTMDGYECLQCGKLSRVVGGLSDCNSGANGLITIKGARGSTMYTSNLDYSHVQLRAIQNLLASLNEQFPHDKIQQNVLSKTAAMYNEIQNIVRKVTTPDGKVVERKIVFRANLKSEVLGAIIHFMCYHCGVARQHSEITEFMQLGTPGISRGENLLRELANQKYITLPADIDPLPDFTTRFLEKLNLLDSSEVANGLNRAADSKCVTGMRYKAFVEDLVTRANDLHISMDSLLPSKVVGAIYILVTKSNLPVTCAQIETACDNVRKNTFMNFATKIEKFILRFVTIFEKHGVPHGIRGRLVRRRKDGSSSSGPRQSRQTAGLLTATV